MSVKVLSEDHRASLSKSKLDQAALRRSQIAYHAAMSISAAARRRRARRASMSLSEEQRIERARKGAAARWGKFRDKQKQETVAA